MVRTQHVDNNTTFRRVVQDHSNFSRRAATMEGGYAIPVQDQLYLNLYHPSHKQGILKVNSLSLLFSNSVNKFMLSSIRIS